MKQSLQLNLSQQLALTPQLQQSIRLLQLSSIELSQELEQMLQENILLERETDESVNTSVYSEKNGAEVEPPAADSLDSKSADSAETDFTSIQSERWEMQSGVPADSEDDNEFTFQESVKPTLRQHLIEQLRVLPLSERDQNLTSVLVDAIDENGYLEQSLEDLAAMLPDELEVDPLELQTALKLVQHLDPLGVGARDLAECLEIQLLVLPEQTFCRDLALSIVREHLALLGGHDYVRLKKILHCDDALLRGAEQLIKRLYPHPGAGFSRIEAGHYIQPEIIVKKVKGLWQAKLNNDAMPKLRINRMYADILKRNSENSNAYLRTQMQEANWFINNLEQRFSTILRVSQAIVDRQRNFFEHGEVAMRPLVLRDIADEVDLHESTISRVTTRKYMLTPRGVYELKYFFGSYVSTESGGTCSGTAIRALVKQLVAAEEPRKPLSDKQISDLLGNQGIVVARRTIAKYRESLQIPAANQRKSI